MREAASQAWTACPDVARPLADGLLVAATAPEGSLVPSAARIALAVRWGMSGILFLRALHLSMFDGSMLISFRMHVPL